MDELSGCGNVLYLLILHTETYHRARYSHNSDSGEEDPQTAELCIVLP